MFESILNAATPRFRLSKASTESAMFLLQLDDEDVSAAVRTNGAVCGARLRAKAAHPIRREDEESAILRYSSDGVLRTKSLRVGSDEGMSKTPRLPAAIGRHRDNFVVPRRGERLAIAPGAGEEGHRVHGIDVVP